MENNNLSKKYVYQQDVIDFVTVAAQTCLFLEKLNEYEKAEFIEKITKLLPLLYLKTLMLQQNEQVLDDDMQRFVSEEDYNYIRFGIENLLAGDDTYLEVFMEDMRYSDTPIAVSISEGLADIYQELKDLAANFQSGNEDVMNDAIYFCLESFREHWGQKLVNTLRALHALYISGSGNED